MDTWCFGPPWVEALGFRVQGSGFRVEGSGFRGVQGLEASGFKVVQSLGKVTSSNRLCYSIPLKGLWTPKIGRCETAEKTPRRPLVSKLLPGFRQLKLQHHKALNPKTLNPKNPETPTQKSACLRARVS